MQITKGVNEFGGLQVAYFGDHHCEKCIRGDVEGTPEKALLLVNLALSFHPPHKLEESMTGR